MDEKKSVILKNTQILISSQEKKGWALVGNLDSVKLGYAATEYLRDDSGRRITFDKMVNYSEKNENSSYTYICLSFLLFYYLYWQIKNYSYLKIKSLIKVYSTNKIQGRANVLQIFKNSINENKHSFSINNKINKLNKYAIRLNYWLKKSGDEIKIGDVICAISINYQDFIFIESKINGILETHKQFHSVDDFENSSIISYNDNLFTIHENLGLETQKELIESRSIFKESIAKDDFSKSDIIKWEKVTGNALIFGRFLPSNIQQNNKLYTFKDGFLIKKGYWADFHLRFTFNYIDDNDFIVFKYDSNNQYKIKNGSFISFKFDNNEVLQYEISKPYKNEGKNYFKSKSILSPSAIKTFSSQKLTKWQIKASENSDEVRGSISDAASQRLLQKFSKKYSETVIKNVSNYKEKKEKSKEIDETCYVYLMVDTANSFYKIGISNSPNYREKTLQSEKPTIELICSKSFINRKIALTIEQSLHSNYNSKRIRGEWFDLNANDIEDIKSILT